MNLIEPIKHHPWLAGAAVGVVLLFFVLRGSGGGSSAAATGSTADPNADQVTIAQLGAQTQIAGIQAGADASAAHDASNIELAKIQNDYAQTHDQLTAQVALSQIEAAAGVTNTANTLTAGVQRQQLTTQEHLAEISSNASVMNTKALTDALLTQSANSAATTKAAIDAQTKIATQSWFSKIF